VWRKRAKDINTVWSFPSVDESFSGDRTQLGVAETGSVPLPFIFSSLLSLLCTLSAVGTPFALCVSSSLSTLPSLIGSHLVKLNAEFTKVDQAGVALHSASSRDPSTSERPGVVEHSRICVLFSTESSQSVIW
jgi:hypothetical protein